MVIPPVETCFGCRIPNPVCLTFHSLVFTPWVELMSGSCLGFSVTSRLFQRGELELARFQAGGRYPFGFSGLPPEPGWLFPRPPKPQVHDFRECDYSVSVNLWAQTHRNQAAQLSQEVIQELLRQLRGTGLSDTYSVDGDPNQVLSRLRTGNLQSPVWSPTPHAPAVQNGVAAVQVPLSGSAAFFRLRRGP